MIWSFEVVPFESVGPMRFGEHIDDVTSALVEAGLTVERSKLNRWWERSNGWGSDTEPDSALVAHMAIFGRHQMDAQPPGRDQTLSWVRARFDRDDRLLDVEVVGTGRRPTAEDPAIRPVLHGIDLFARGFPKVCREIERTCDLTIAEPPGRYDQIEVPELGLRTYRHEPARRYFETASAVSRTLSEWMGAHPLR